MAVEGALDQVLGAAIRVLGETFLDLGAAIRVLGETFLDLGAAIRVPGETFPDLGAAIRVLGETFPDLDTAILARSVAAIAPVAGAVPRWTTWPPRETTCD
ncbi:uncharacterized protein LOC144708921 [Wolffia australiana]